MMFKKRYFGPKLKMWEDLNLGQMLMIITVMILVITVAMPMVMIVYNTFFIGARLDLGIFDNIIFTSDTMDAMWNTIVIGFFVTLLGTIVGLFFAWLIGRSDIPLKGFMKTLFIVPYMFPPFIGAMAWGLLLSSRSGYLNKMFMSFTGGTTPFFNINSIAGIIFVEICYYFPFVFIQVSSALERMDPTLEESARIAGASQLYVIRKITFPLVLPAIAAGSMLILISSLSHFALPAILG
ncbi:MAG: ABC transporter permease subunit, partial [Bacteroidales bacterium]|nr:ABC transporter permease subunit [Candidatus Latescibacterota bacterium]